MNITLDGKTFPVRANMRAWKNFEDETGAKVSQIDTNDVTKMPMLVYYFVKEGCAKQGMKFDMPMDEFLSLIEVSDLAMLAEVVEQSMSPQGEKKAMTEANLVGTK
jgi:hypothetical protein